MKQEDLTIKEEISKVFSESLVNGKMKIFKEDLVKIVRGHDKLWDKDLRYAKRSVVQTVYVISLEWLNFKPPIFIMPFPIFNLRYDGWQIVTEKSKIDKFMQQIACEKIRKDLRKFYQLWIKIQKEAESSKTIGLLKNDDIKKIDFEERGKYRSDSKKFKWVKLLK